MCGCVGFSSETAMLVFTNGIEEMARTSYSSAQMPAHLQQPCGGLAMPHDVNMIYLLSQKSLLALWTCGLPGDFCEHVKQDE